MSANPLEDIYSTWFTTNTHLAMIADDLLPGGLSRAQAHAVNDCGIFLLLFAQLEAAINRAYLDQFGRNWHEAPFASRVDMLRDLVGDVVAEEILDHYEVRCEVAHGRHLESIPIELSEAAQLYLEVVESRLA